MKSPVARGLQLGWHAISGPSTRSRGFAWPENGSDSTFG